METARDRSHARKVFNSVGNTSRSYDAVGTTLLGMILVNKVVILGLHMCTCLKLKWN